LLDKTVPYYNVIMVRKAGAAIPRTELPAGFSFASYVAGKERAWAEIETSAGEFDAVEGAQNYFTAEYVPYMEELQRRLLFVCNATGREVATITGWWNMTGARRDPSVHWASVHGEYQGLGLGKALIFEGLRRLVQLEGDRDVYLHTQTWSYKAIGIYLRAGFRLLEHGSFGAYRNEYVDALPILRERLDERSVALLEAPSR
jgi:ribosomal protein S18 acetylase RimI-like enzyme